MLAIGFGTKSEKHVHGWRECEPPSRSRSPPRLPPTYAASRAPYTSRLKNTCRAAHASTPRSSSQPMTGITSGIRSSGEMM